MPTDTDRTSATTHTIATPVHGRYLVVPATGETPAPLLVGYHGYGEHADRQLEELQQIPGVDRWTIVSIQALHRFYSASRRHVVGSWMTRQDRDAAIVDNLAYVDGVIQAVRTQQPTTDTVVHCGFSQGVAMAYRAARRGAARGNGVIALAGDVPPELQSANDTEWPAVLIGRGESDEWYTKTKMDADLAFFASIDHPVDTLVMAAGHEWTDQFRDEAARFLERLR